MKNGINISVKENVNLKLTKKEIRKKYKLFKGMDCSCCNKPCPGICQALVVQIKSDELRCKGGCNEYTDYINLSSCSKIVDSDLNKYDIDLDVQDNFMNDDFNKNNS